MGDNGRTTGAGSTASALAGDALGQHQGQELLPTALVLPVVWRHLATYGPPVDLRTALAAACACRASRAELQAMVTRGRLERPSQVRLTIHLSTTGAVTLPSAQRFVGSSAICHLAVPAMMES